MTENQQPTQSINEIILDADKFDEEELKASPDLTCIHKIKQKNDYTNEIDVNDEEFKNFKEDTYKDQIITDAVFDVYKTRTEKIDLDEHEDVIDAIAEEQSNGEFDFSQGKRIASRHSQDEQIKELESEVRKLGHLIYKLTKTDNEPWSPSFEFDRFRDAKLELIEQDLKEKYNIAQEMRIFQYDQEIKNLKSEIAETKKVGFKSVMLTAGAMVLGFAMGLMFKN